MIVIEQQVEAVLRDEPETRNDDRLLTWRIWQRFYGVSDAITRHDYLSRLPSQDDVKRYRAKIQNDQHRFVPTRLDVARHRHWKEDEWRAVLGYQPVAALRHPQKTSGLTQEPNPKTQPPSLFGTGATPPDPKRFMN